MPAPLPGTVDPEVVFRFEVIVDDVYYAAFTEFRLPDLEVQTTDVIEGGQNTFVHKLPVRVNTGPAVIKRGITADMSLVKWYMQVVNGDIANAKRQVSIVMYGDEGTRAMTWNFRDAYPVKWVGPSFTAGDSSIAFEELHFVHHGFTIETEAGTFSTGGR